MVSGFHMPCRLNFIFAPSVVSRLVEIDDTIRYDFVLLSLFLKNLFLKRQQTTRFANHTQILMIILSLIKFCILLCLCLTFSILLLFITGNFRLILLLGDHVEIYGRVSLLISDSYGRWWGSARRAISVLTLVKKYVYRLCNYNYHLLCISCAPPTRLLRNFELI
jgi:hypothetical protein